MAKPDWSALQHAYGPASNIPALLEEARTAPVPRSVDVDPWYSLWSALYHQDCIYSASYAAVPELIRIAELRTDAGRAEALLLAASIELRAHEDGAPSMPRELRESYAAALQAARRIVETALSANSSADRLHLLTIAAAVFTGQHELARELLEQDEREAAR